MLYNFTKYSGTVILHIRSLDTFYYSYKTFGIGKADMYMVGNIALNNKINGRKYHKSYTKSCLSETEVQTNLHIEHSITIKTVLHELLISLHLLQLYMFMHFLLSLIEVKKSK